MKEGADVLLVEDDPGDVELTRKALKTASIIINLHAVHDGVSALSYLKQRPPYADAVRPDLVLLDLNLPKKDGREVLKEIKGDPALSSIPVIILTTSGSASDVARCADLGAERYITKPLGFASFTEVVREIDDFLLSLVKRPAAGKDMP